MAEAIFQAINDWGTTTLSTNARTLNLRHRRTIPASSWNNNVLFRSTQAFTIEKSAYVRPVFAFLSAGDGGPNMITMRVRSNATQYIIQFMAWTQPVRPAAVDFFIFDDYLPPRDNYGIELLDAAGNVTYNSAWPNMRIARIHTLPASTPSFLTGTTTVNIPGFQTVTNMAAAFSMNRDYYHGSGEGDGYSLQPGLRKAGASYECQLVCYASESENYPGGGAVPFTGYLTNGPVTILFIDTTYLPAAPFG